MAWAKEVNLLFDFRAFMVMPQSTLRRRKFDPRSAAAASGNRLLVVDDNKDAATSLAMLLRLQGHEVEVAFSGVAALEIAKTFQPASCFLRYRHAGYGWLRSSKAASQ